MKLKFLSLVFALTTFAGTSAIAGESPLERLVNACETDIQTYCSQVKPGNGRILHCMAAHEDKISGQCEYSLYQAAALLEQLTVAIAYVASACKTEIQTLCANVEPGEGRILACLDNHQENVGADCTKAIADTVGQ
jgi:hypothetical protein